MRTKCFVCRLPADTEADRTDPAFGYEGFFGFEDPDAWATIVIHKACFPKADD
jgi:hypothetical protein